MPAGGVPSQPVVTRKVDVGDCVLVADVRAGGRTTILFESGGSDDATAWTDIEPAVASGTGRSAASISSGETDPMS